MPTVWISRPRHRATELATALSARQITPLLYPAMDIGEPPDAAPLASYLATLSSFALHVFVSREAASRVAAQLPAGQAILPALTIGAATAAALSPRYQLQRRSPTISDSHQLLQLPLLQQPRGRIAILGGCDDDGTPPAPLLGESLRQRGNDVLSVPCYCRRPAVNSELPALGQQGGIDAAIAYSSDSLRFMLQMTAPDNNWLRQLPLFVIHPNIAATAQTLGFQQVHTAAGHELAPAIAHHLTH